MLTRKLLIPSPADRPTEYITAVVAAVLAVIAVFVQLPDGLEPALLGLFVVLTPGVTWLVARRRRGSVRDGTIKQ